MAVAVAPAASAAELNLSSPRTKAAMRVLGVLPKDVRKLDPATFEGKEVKMKMMEQKRLNLIAEVKQFAEKTPDVSDGGKKTVLDPGAERESKTRAFLEEVEEQERANFERLQIMAKKDVQSIVIGELTAKKAAFLGSKKQQESAQRLKECMATRDAELQVRKKEAAKKQDKNEDVRKRSLATLAQKNAELSASLKKADELCCKKIDDIALQRQEQKDKNDVRRKELAERQSNYESQLVQDRHSSYKEHVEKHEAKLEILADRLAQRQSDAALIAERQRQSSERVKQKQENKEVESRLKYLENVDRHKVAAGKRDENLKAQIKEYAGKNQKRQTMHQSRFDRIQAELEKSPGIKLSASSAPGSPVRVVERSDKRRDAGSSFNSLYKSQSDSMILGVADRRRDHGEVVGSNKERLRRARHYMVQEQIDKLDNMRQRVQIMQDAKTEADKRRMVVMRNTSLEKMNLTERVARVRDSADPEKMNRMLEDLEPDREAVDKINDLLGTMGMQQMAGGTAQAEEEKR